MLCPDAAVHDPGTKYNTSCTSVDCGRCTCTAFVEIFVVEASVTWFDGAPSLNGFGDLEFRIHVTVVTCEPTVVCTLAPGTRSGY